MPVRMKRVPHAFLARFRITTRECVYEFMFYSASRLLTSRAERVSSSQAFILIFSYTSERDAHARYKHVSALLPHLLRPPRGGGAAARRDGQVPGDRAALRGRVPPEGGRDVGLHWV